MSRYGLTSTVAYGMCSVNNGGMLAKYYAVEPAGPTFAQVLRLANRHICMTFAS